MFTDPQSLTYNAGSVSIPRTSSAGRSSTYTSATGGFELTVSHTVNKAERSVVRLVHEKLAADPLNPATNRPYTMAVTLTMNRPLNVGYTDAEALLVYNAFVAYINDATFKTKFTGLEH